MQALKKAICLIALGCICFTVFSQVSFERTYTGIAGATESWGTSVIQDHDLGYIICARALINGKTNFLLIKTGATGDTVMTKRFYGSASGLIAAHDGGFIVTGSANGHLLMMKTDPVFNIEWADSVTLFATGQAVCQAGNDGYCFAGSRSYNPIMNKELVVARTDKDGQLLWTTYLGGYYGDFNPRSVIQSSDDGFIVCGSIRPWPGGTSSAFLLKLNSSGDSIWMKTFRRSDYSNGYAVLPTAGNGCLAFAMDGVTNVNTRLYLINTNAQGDTSWTKTYKCFYDAGVLAATKIRRGGYLVAGTVTVDTINHADICLVRINEEGDTLWTKRVGSNLTELPSSVNQTMDDGFIIGGYVGNLPSVPPAIYLVKTDSLGRYYPLDISEHLNSSDIRIFPNPFKTSFSVEVSKPVDNMEIINMLGRCVYSWANDGKTSAGNTVSLDDQPAGIYILRIIAGGSMQTRKLVKIK